MFSKRLIQSEHPNNVILPQNVFWAKTEKISKVNNYRQLRLGKEVNKDFHLQSRIVSYMLHDNSSMLLTLHITFTMSVIISVLITVLCNCKKIGRRLAIVLALGDTESC